MPVFAALDGIVVEVSDNLPDEHVERTMTQVDNHVIVSSLGRHVHTVYGHLRKGVMVRDGQRVVAGQQIGWTASSGHSSGPHLHFTMKLDYQVYEPFAGPCRPGQSYWRDQAAIPTGPYVRDFTFSRKPFGGRRDPPWDEAVRTGTFPRGLRDVYFRTELAFFDGGPMHVTVTRPDGSVALAALRVDAAPGLPGHVRELARAARSRPARDVAPADGERRPNARGRAVHGRRRTQSAAEPDRSSARPRAADEQAT